MSPEVLHFPKVLLSVLIPDFSENELIPFEHSLAGHSCLESIQSLSVLLELFVYHPLVGIAILVYDLD